MNKNLIIIFIAIILSGILLIYGNQKEIEVVKFEPEKTDTNTHIIQIPETGFSIEVKKQYVLEKSGYWDGNTIPAYGFKQISKKDYIKPPYLNRIVFLNEETLKDWVKNCTGECLEYPDGGPSPETELDLYYKQKDLFNRNDFNSDNTKQFNGRNWFVSNESCIGDSCEYRIYSTFIGDTQIIVSVEGWPTEAFSNSTADYEFSFFKIN